MTRPRHATDPTDAVREHLLWLLDGGYAHVGLAELLGRLPPGREHDAPAGLPHSAYQLVEHLRRCQADLLAYGLDADHVSPDFPDGYWPSEPGDLAETTAAYDADRGTFRDLVRARDPLATLPHADVTLARNVLVAVDHDAYHLGQLAQVAYALS